MIVEIYLKNPNVWETLNNGRMRSDNLMSYKVHEYIRQTYHSLKHFCALLKCRSFYAIIAQYSRTFSPNIENHTVSWLTFVLNCNYVAFFLYSVHGDIVHDQRMQDINITK